MDLNKHNKFNSGHIEDREDDHMKMEHKENDNSINFRYVKAIVTKDWKEIRGNRDLFLPIIILPLIFSVLMPIILAFGALVDPTEFGVSTSYEAVKMMTDLMLKPMYTMIPTMISMIIASDSFAGEKERKTAETLLVLPISHQELFLGKLLTALIPAIIFEFISFFVMSLVLNIMIWNFITQGYPLLILTDPSFWLIAFLLCTVFSIINVEFGLVISARSKDMKSAQSVSGVAVVPVLALIFSSMLNPLFLSNIWIIIIMSAILSLIAYIYKILGTKVINREKLIANLS